MRQHEEQPRRAHDHERGIVGRCRNRGDARLHDAPDLHDDDHREDPTGRAARGPETSTSPTEVGAVPQPGAPPEQHEHECLSGDPESGGAGQHGDHLGRPCRGVADVGVEQQPKRDHAADRHQIVDRGRPGERPKHPARVEHLTKERVQRVEQHLRQAPVGEGDGERNLIGRESARTGAVGRRGVEAHEERRGERRNDAGDEKDHDADRDEPVDEPLTAVCIDTCADDLWHQHRTQHAARDDCVDVVGQLVRQGEGVGSRAKSAESLREHDGADEAEHARDDRS